MGIWYVIRGFLLLFTHIPHGHFTSPTPTLPFCIMILKLILSSFYIYKGSMSEPPHKWYRVHTLYFTILLDLVRIMQPLHGHVVIETTKQSLIKSLRPKSSSQWVPFMMLFAQSSRPLLLFDVPRGQIKHASYPVAQGGYFCKQFSIVPTIKRIGLVRKVRALFWYKGNATYRILCADIVIKI